MTGLDVGRAPDPDFWRGRRVLVSGHTGFQGAWLTLWLKRLGAEVSAFGLTPERGPNLHDLAGVAGDCDGEVVDVRDRSAVARKVVRARPEIVLHLAAQTQARQAMADPAGTFEVNLGGTVNLLEVLRGLDGVLAALVATCDEVYARDGAGGPPLREDAPLGGIEPYAASKAAAELAARAYAESQMRRRGVRVATARGGEVIGGGDFAEDRAAPDCVRAAMAGEPVRLRHAQAARPWQHVLDRLCGYLLHAEALALEDDCPRALNFGPSPTADLPMHGFAEIMLTELGAVNALGRPNIVIELAPGAAEPSRRRVDASLARRSLDWCDALVGREAVEATAQWYRRWRDGEDMRAATLDEIERYQAAE